MTETPAQPPFVPYEGAVPPPPPVVAADEAGDPVVRLDQALIAVGVALLSATAAMAAFYSRVDGDLDASNFVMGLAATLGLLGIAGGARILVHDEARSSELMAWPGAFGAVAAGLMVAVLMDDNDVTGYIAGGVVISLSAAGYYLLVRRGAFVVSTIVGLLVVYTSLVNDAFDAVDFDSDNPGIIVGTAVLVFAVMVTAAGWVLPETRVLSAVVVGVIAVVSNAGVLVGLTIVASFARAFGGGFSEFDTGGDQLSPFDSEMTLELDDVSSPYNNDAWLVLVFSLILVAVWAYLTYATGHVGFPLLMAAMCASVIPLVTTVIAIEHPTWWEVVVGAVGGGVLVLAGLRAAVRRDSP